MATYYYESGSLKHHGVKGMRWGVRKARRLTDYTIGKRSAASQTQQTQRDYDSTSYQQPSWLRRNGKKLAIGLGATAAVGAGAVIVHKILKKKGINLGTIASSKFKSAAAKGRSLIRL